MKKLPEDFALDRYGLHVRLVCKEDAPFIVALRTDATLGRYISDTSADVSQQEAWIACYKQREAAGTDYYFIYYHQGNPVGVNRIYDIEEDHFVHGSWVFSKEASPYCALAAAVIAREIAFDTLELMCEEDNVGIHKENTGVWQFARFMGEVFTGSHQLEKGEYLTGYLTKEAFEKNKSKICRLFPKKVV